jgi:molybdopterin-containing oxidoreductase family iron-sulfur binding subunit
VPESHYLESWGDLRAFDGTASIVQPLISPLYNASRSSLEFVSALLGEERSAYEILRKSWRARGGNADFETFWAAALRKGTIPSSAPGPVNVTFNAGALSQADRRSKGPNNALELTFRLDPNLLDGRYANNGWLQEIPKPFTQLTWDNAAIMSPATARRLNLESRRIVHLQLQGGDVTAPVWVQPGHPDDSVTVHLGYGRSRAGHVGGIDSERVGFNANLLRTSDAMSFASGLKIIATEDFYPMACTQTHQSLEGRELVRVRTAEQVRAGFAGVAAVGSEPQGVRNERSVKLSLYPDYYSGDKNHQFTPDKGHQWGMVIDNNACIGCTACVTACVAENNIPVVGKDQVIREREMHWIRIDTYYKGEGDDPDGPYFEPMLCQHCENAPCEIVCPVEATSHSAEGLNEMTYNRCIGTRYCSNNCPYKVRRFNFLQYTDTQTPQIKMQRNPNVTVRKRGVMEKCTYCVQRINRTRIDVKRLDVQRSESTDQSIATQLRQQMDDLMRDLQPACQQACPTEAIIFGDLNWKFKDDSAPYVVQLKEQIENFGILAELNTNPRTTYLPHLRNPNPALVMENAGGAPVPHS